jgi:hypothetical protein
MKYRTGLGRLGGAACPNATLAALASTTTDKAAARYVDLIFGPPGIGRNFAAIIHQIPIKNVVGDEWSLITPRS